MGIRRNDPGQFRPNRNVDALAELTSRCADFITYAELRDGFTRLRGNKLDSRNVGGARHPAEVGSRLVGRVSPPSLWTDGTHLCLALDLLEGPPPETSTGGNVQTRKASL